MSVHNHIREKYLTFSLAELGRAGLGQAGLPHPGGGRREATGRGAAASCEALRMRALRDTPSLGYFVFTHFFPLRKL